ncbi:LEA_2 domain-containing protein [Cephalotus follicularis]|uniref:LEA_2 domain-containing protein n=1 Tax=Cephalotus follicularis TaxID=3775 RepID=A0A1Q3CNQ5_CEPFO|nr:LEA_2 domain-containing protein [Cephalotus follicularis]
MDHAHNRVYPLDVEASYSMHSTDPQPQKYIMLNNNQGNLRPPPNRRNIPRYHSANPHSKSGGNCCLRCICCCYCFLIILVLISAALAFYLYSLYQPKIPSYKLDRFEVQAFNIQSDFSVNTEFSVTVKAENPNEHIGFTYGEDSSVIVAYQDTTLCSGKLPAFHQPEKNTSMINVVLKGKSEFGSGLQEALMENQDSGRIPLLVEVKAPVKVTIVQLQLREVVVFVNCSLVVDSLSANKKPQILSTKYSYDIQF